MLCKAQYTVYILYATYAENIRIKGYFLDKRYSHSKFFIRTTF